MAATTTGSSTPPAGPPVPAPRRVVSLRTRSDRVFHGLATTAGASTLVILVLIGTFLSIKAWPAFQEAGLKFFTTTQWLPPPRGNSFGVAALLYWTVMIALIALFIAVPVSIAAAIFITEFCPRWAKGPLTSLVDLLAAVPSLIYGHVGRRSSCARACWGSPHGWRNTSGSSPCSSPPAPTPSSVLPPSSPASWCPSWWCPSAPPIMREVFSQVPPGEKEGALALGGTTWGMIRSVVLPFGRGGIIGGSMLGLGRALGETIAILLIISPIYQIRANIVEAGANSIAAHIANQFGNSSGIALSGLLAAGVVLFAMTLLVNLAAAAIVSRSRSGAGVEI